MMTATKQAYLAMSDPDQWPQVFRDISSEHWENRMRRSEPCRFVTELADAIIDMERTNGDALRWTMEALGGAWNRNMAHLRFAGASRLGYVTAESPKELAYKMVASRFDHLGPFEVVGFNSGDARVIPARSY